MAAPESGASHEHGNGALLRDLAHELRDALSPVTSSLDVLRLQRFAPEAGRRTADEVERALQRALATIDAFIFAEECERGSPALEVRRCNLRDLLESARAALPERVAVRCAFMRGGAEAAVSADVQRSIEVLTALLQHAAAASAPGSLLQVRQAGEPAPQIRIRLRMHPGSSAGENWFAGFRVGSAARMALRTARQLLAAQGGGLRVEIAGPGECELVASFAAAAAQDLGAAAPAAAAATAASPARVGGSAAGACGMRIIIVDDSAEVRNAYREPLVTLGYTVTEAVDAEQALRTMDGDPPDVALIDIHLPRMNGYRLAELLKARVGDSMRLIMLSGMTLDATTRRLSREAGFDDCLDKMAGPMALHLLLQGAAAR
jgi:CheY-like chemotaxis protein